MLSIARSVYAKPNPGLSSFFPYFEFGKWNSKVLPSAHLTGVAYQFHGVSG